MNGITGNSNIRNNGKLAGPGDSALGMVNGRPVAPGASNPVENRQVINRIEDFANKTFTLFGNKVHTFNPAEIKLIIADLTANQKASLCQDGYTGGFKKESLERQFLAHGGTAASQQDLAEILWGRLESAKIRMKSVETKLSSKACETTDSVREVIDDCINKAALTDLGTGGSGHDWQDLKEWKDTFGEDRFAEITKEQLNVLENGLKHWRSATAEDRKNLKSERELLNVFVTNANKTLKIKAGEEKQDKALDDFVDGIGVMSEPKKKKCKVFARFYFGLKSLQNEADRTECKTIIQRLIRREDMETYVSGMIDSCAKKKNVKLSDEEWKTVSRNVMEGVSFNDNWENSGDCERMLSIYRGIGEANVSLRIDAILLQRPKPSDVFQGRLWNSESWKGVSKLVKREDGNLFKKFESWCQLNSRAVDDEQAQEDFIKTLNVKFDSVLKYMSDFRSYVVGDGKKADAWNDLLKGMDDFFRASLENIGTNAENIEDLQLSETAGKLGLSERGVKNICKWLFKKSVEQCETHMNHLVLDESEDDKDWGDRAKNLSKELWKRYIAEIKSEAEKNANNWDDFEVKNLAQQALFEKESPSDEEIDLWTLCGLKQKITDWAGQLKEAALKEQTSRISQCEKKEPDFSSESIKDLKAALTPKLDERFRAALGNWRKNVIDPLVKMLTGGNLDKLKLDSGVRLLLSTKAEALFEGLVGKTANVSGFIDNAGVVQKKDTKNKIDSLMAVNGETWLKTYDVKNKVGNAVRGSAFYEQIIKQWCSDCEEKLGKCLAKASGPNEREGIVNSFVQLAKDIHRALEIYVDSQARSWADNNAFRSGIAEGMRGVFDNSLVNQSQTHADVEGEICERYAYLVTTGLMENIQNKVNALTKDQDKRGVLMSGMKEGCKAYVFEEMRFAAGKGEKPVSDKNEKILKTKICERIKDFTITGMEVTTDENSKVLVKSAFMSGRGGNNS